MGTQQGEPPLDGSAVGYHRGGPGVRESRAMTPTPDLAPSIDVAEAADAADTVQHPLEPSGAEMRRLVEAALARIVPHVESLPSQPSVAVQGAVELARSLAEPLPETGTPLPALLDLLFERAI